MRVYGGVKIDNATILAIIWSHNFNLNHFNFDMSEKTLVVQHNKLVEARYKLTVEEQRLIKMLVSKIQPKDDDFKVYEIRVLDLSKLLGITDDYYYNKIKILTKKLRDSSLSFTNENGDEIQTGWLSSATYRKGKGVVGLCFDPVLKPYLLQLKSLFTSYELGNILRLRGMYSIRIYELLKQYEKIGKREFTLDAFKQMLKIESEYKQYKDFKRHVLLPAQNEVSEKTDIAFSIEEKKQGKKVIGFVFHIKGKARPQTINEAAGQTSAGAISVATQHAAGQEGSENGYVGRLTDMGVTRQVAVRLATDFDGARISRAIAITEEKQKTGHLKDKAAFVVAAIQKDYNDALAEEKRKKAEVLRLKNEQANIKKQWQAINSRYNDWKTQAVEAALSAMAPEKIEAHRRQFEQSPTYEALKAIFKSKATLERHFLIYLRVQLPFDTLEEWAQKNGVDLSGFSDEVQLG